MTQACTIAAAKTVFTASGSPFRPSQTVSWTSLTPRFNRSVSTSIQNLIFVRR